MFKQYSLLILRGNDWLSGFLLKIKSVGFWPGEIMLGLTITEEIVTVTIVSVE